MADHRGVGLTRERIAQAAVEVGFDDLSMVAVAKHLGVSGPALYYHFDNQAELVRAAIGRVIAMAPEPLANPGSIAELVHSEAENMLATIENHPGIVAAAAETILRRPPEIEDRTAQLAYRVRALGIAEVAVPVVAGLMDFLLFQLLRGHRTDDGGEMLAQRGIKLKILTAGFEALIESGDPAPDSGR
ncbi:MAG: helix-turn-helix domain-containing protein [Actinomycetota bacterium]